MKVAFNIIHFNTGDEIVSDKRNKRKSNDGPDSLPTMVGPKPRITPSFVPLGTTATQSGRICESKIFTIILTKMKNDNHLLRILCRIREC